jgi:hypothetical protein
MRVAASEVGDGEVRGPIAVKVADRNLASPSTGWENKR